MLFQQLHVGDRHASVHGFTHVINGEQGDLHGGQGFPRKGPKTVALRPLNFWSTCPEFLGLVGQDWDKTPKPEVSIEGVSDTRQGKWACSFRVVCKTQSVRILAQFSVWRDPTVPPPANAADQHGSDINHCSSQTSEISGESCLTLDRGLLWLWPARLWVATLRMPSVTCAPSSPSKS